MQKHISVAMTVIMAMAFLFIFSACESVPHSDEVPAGKPMMSVLAYCNFDGTGDCTTVNDMDGNGKCNYDDCTYARNVIGKGTWVCETTPTTAAPSTQCPNGGSSYACGYDTDNDGIANTPAGSMVTCKGDKGDKGDAGTNGTNGTNGYSQVCDYSLNIVLAASTTCPNGALGTPCGLDLNSNNVYDAAEFAGYKLSCNGADGKPGTNGTNGSNGHSWLCDYTTPSVIAPDSTCLTGGLGYRCGSDINDDGVLAPLESTKLQVVCSGASGTNGTNGSNGHSWLCDYTTPSVIAPDSTCLTGGLGYRCGSDINDDGILNSLEGTQVQIACAGPKGDKGDSPTMVDHYNGTCTLTYQGVDYTVPCDTAAFHAAWDFDFDCKCKTGVAGVCSGSSNPACTTVVPGDTCESDGKGTDYVVCQKISTTDLSNQEVRLFADGCLLGYRQIGTTGATYFDNCTGPVIDGDTDSETEVVIDGDSDSESEVVIDGDTDSESEEVVIDGDTDTDSETETPVDPSLWDYDGDGFCANKTVACVGSSNPIWTVAELKNNDCDDDPLSGGFVAALCEDNASHEIFLMENTVTPADYSKHPICPTGSIELLKTDGSFLNNPAMNDSTLDSIDNNCNDAYNEGGVDPCLWSNKGGTLWKVTCTWLKRTVSSTP